MPGVGTLHPAIVYIGVDLSLGDLAIDLRHVHVHAMHAVGLGVVAVRRKLVPHEGHDQQAADDAAGKAGGVDQRVARCATSGVALQIRETLVRR